MSSAGGFFTTQTDAWPRRIGEEAADAAAVVLASFLFPPGFDARRGRLLLFQRDKESEPHCSDGPGSLPATTFNRQTYTTARQKFDQFFADPAQRNMTLSNAEVNALLAESPELRLFQHGTVVVLDQNSAEVYCQPPCGTSIATSAVLELRLPDASIDARRGIGFGRFTDRNEKANPWERQRSASIKSSSCH